MIISTNDCPIGDIHELVALVVHEPNCFPVRALIADSEMAKVQLSVRYGRVPKRSREKHNEDLKDGMGQMADSTAARELETKQLAIYDIILTISQAHHANCAYTEERTRGLTKKLAVFNEYVLSLINLMTSLNSLQLNDTEIGLLSAIILFMPDRNGIYDQKSIEQQQDKFSEALKMQVARNHMSDMHLFSNIMHKIPELRILGNKHAEHLYWLRSNWMKLTLPPLFAEIFDIPKAEDDDAEESENQLIFDVEHSFSNTKNTVYKPRGVINVKSIRSGVASFTKESSLSDEDKYDLRNVVGNDGFYHVQVIARAASQSYFISSFMKACLLYESKLSDILTVNVDQSGSLLGISVTTMLPQCQGITVLNEDITSFNSTLIVVTTEPGPVPDTQAYVHKLEQEKDAKAKGEQPDNRSFFAKYGRRLVVTPRLYLPLSYYAEMTNLKDRTSDIDVYLKDGGIITKVASRNNGAALSGFQGAPNSPRHFGSSANKKSAEGGEELNKLPLPKLHHTINKYIRYAKPFLSEQDFNSTQKAAKEFVSPGNLGEKLQLMLEEKHRYTLNWHFDVYRNITYLERRLPLPFHTTPTGQLYYKDWTADKQLSNAAGYIRGLARAQYILDDDSSPFVELDGRKLDKKLWRQVFNNYHFPSKPMDYVVHYGYLETKPSHFIVAHKNMFFKVEVRGKDGLTFSKNVIEEQLNQISKIAETEKQEPVGILTWLPRDDWADAYNLLRQDSQNCESLEEIQRAGLVVPVDSEVPRDILVEDQHNAQLELGVHGGGPRYNAANRWFDKLGFVVHKQFGFGILMEHSVLDGFPCMWIMFTAEDEMHKNDTSVDSSDTEVPVPKLLKFNISPEVKTWISKATESAERMAKDTDVKLTNIHEFGAKDVKAMKLSPNGLCQMAQQMAYFKVNDGKMDHILEAAGLLHFYQGRTDGIRCSSQESIDLCKAMSNPKKSDSEKLDLLLTALKVHKKEMIEVMTGNGLDDHLAIMYQMAKERGIDRHPFFDDKAFTEMYQREKSLRVVWDHGFRIQLLHYILLEKIDFNLVLSNRSRTQRGQQHSSTRLSTKVF
ncbi:Carnitine O-acetyltransferase [Nymphon striatum]|nr:Carnitine O-acetyltransferase [Nymphon striatum]